MSASPEPWGIGPGTVSCRVASRGGGVASGIAFAIGDLMEHAARISGVIFGGVRHPNVHHLAWVNVEPRRCLASCTRPAIAGRYHRGVTHPRLLVLDFDGTVCLGDDPVLLYAREVDRVLRVSRLDDSPQVAALVEAALQRDSLAVDEIEMDPSGVPVAVLRERASSEPELRAHPTSWPLQDGYQLVQLLGVQAGLTSRQLGEAFMTARTQLLDRGLEHSDVHAPAGAAEFLGELRRSAWSVVLITNAPAITFATWLDYLGLARSFDLVINDARKPSGMSHALQAVHDASGLGGEPPSFDHVISVGDIWENDLEYVASHGGVTVLIDRFTTGLGQPDHRVNSWAGAAAVLRAPIGLSLDPGP